ncbi:MAG: hypothetical protein WDN46_02305 [Methylocella sp.]
MRSAANQCLAFLALLALVLAPLHLCCSPSASFAGPGFDAAAPAILCIHDGAKGGGPNDPTPASGQCDDCLCCHLANAAALVPPPAMAQTAYAPRPIARLAGPKTLGTLAPAFVLAAQPRGPPALI